MRKKVLTALIGISILVPSFGASAAENDNPTYSKSELEKAAEASNMSASELDTILKTEWKEYKNAKKDWAKAPNDGKLNIAIIYGIPRWKVLFVFISVFLGIHHKINGVKLLEGKNISITSDTKMLIAADGEIVGTTPIEIGVKQKIRTII